MRPLTWDDEDRQTSASGPGYSDTFTYTGLGLRLTKNDSTGGYAYLCDGISPASSILSDGRLSFTPGISQTLGTPNGAGGLSYASHFYAADALGTLRGMTDGGAQGFSDGLNFDGFGNLVGRVGSTSVPLGYREGSGYVTDADTGLRLLGHRYYDSRTGRFISQDPIGDGDNWYAYAGNDPTDETDPDGLSIIFAPSPTLGLSEIGAFQSASFDSFAQSYDLQQEFWHRTLTRATWGKPGSAVYSNVLVGDTGWIYDGSIPLDEPSVGGGRDGGMIANFYITPAPRPEPLGHYLLRQLLSGGQADGSYFVPASGSIVPGRGIGPSGNPKLHFPKYKTKKEAWEAAKRASKGGQDPIHHENPEVGERHYHAADENGATLKNGVHYGY